MKTPEQKAKRLLEHSQDPSLAHLDMAESLEQIAENTSPKEVQKVEIVTNENELAKTFWSMLRGPQGEKGDQGIQGEVGPQGEPGKDSTIPGPKGDKGDPGRDGQDGLNADPSDIVPLVLERIKLPEYKETVLDDGEKIVQKINDLPTDDDDLKIDVSHIKGFEELQKDITGLKNRPVISGGIMGRDLVKDIDISSQLDGVTKTFNIQAVWNIISVNLSSFPYGALRKGIDFTWTPTSITFTDEITASAQLAAGQTCILTVVQA